MSENKAIDVSPPLPLSFPSLVYGTADPGSGKPVQLHAAISMGYRVIDTGKNGPYDEAATGAILSSMFSGESETAHSPTSAKPPPTNVQRDQIILQAKYSPAVLFHTKQPPYHPADTISLQVLKSFQATLLNLRLSHVDVYFLHRPFLSLGHTFAAWEVMEEIVRHGGARYLGISQVGLELLETLVQRAEIPPRVMQNYCCSANGYDRDVRAYCRDHGMVYQGFGMLGEIAGASRGEEEGPGGGEGSRLAACLIAARVGGETFLCP